LIKSKTSKLTNRVELMGEFNVEFYYGSNGLFTGTITFAKSKF